MTKKAKTPKKKQFPPTLYVERDDDGDDVFFNGNPDLLDVCPAPGLETKKVGVYVLHHVLDVWSDPNSAEAKNPNEDPGR